MQSFDDYIKILKILRNTCTRNENFSKLVLNAFLRFVKKPSLFNNLEELFEVDELHTTLYRLGNFHTQVGGDQINRGEAK